MQQKVWCINSEVRLQEMVHISISHNPVAIMQLNSKQPNGTETMWLSQPCHSSQLPGVIKHTKKATLAQQIPSTPPSTCRHLCEIS
jgi:hypothetical protein